MYVCRNLNVTVIDRFQARAGRLQRRECLFPFV